MKNFENQNLSPRSIAARNLVFIQACIRLMKEVRGKKLLATSCVIGLLLKEVKPILPHGDWLHFVDLSGLSRSHCNQLMKIAEHPKIVRNCNTFRGAIGRIRNHLSLLSCNPLTPIQDNNEPAYVTDWGQSPPREAINDDFEFSPNQIAKMSFVEKCELARVGVKIRFPNGKIIQLPGSSKRLPK